MESKPLTECKGEIHRFTTCSCISIFDGIPDMCNYYTANYFTLLLYIRMSSVRLEWTRGQSSEDGGSDTEATSTVFLETLGRLVHMVPFRGF